MENSYYEDFKQKKSDHKVNNRMRLGKIRIISGWRKKKDFFSIFLKNIMHKLMINKNKVYNKSIWLNLVFISRSSILFFLWL